MLAPGSVTTNKLLKEEAKKPVEKEVAKKVKGFHLGREPTIFPGVSFDINDHELVDLLAELDQIYDKVHHFHVIFTRYTKIIENLTKVHEHLGPQATKIYPQGHPNNPTSVMIASSHSECSQNFKDFLQNHKQTQDLFKAFYSKFEAIANKLKNRDKALENFNHYFQKMKTLNDDKQLRMKLGNPDPVKEARDAELFTRNDKKYQEALKDFQLLNNSLYNDITDMLRSKYKSLTPIVIRFITVAQVFFQKTSSSFYQLGQISDRANTIQQPQNFSDPGYGGYDDVGNTNNYNEEYKYGGGTNTGGYEGYQFQDLNLDDYGTHQKPQQQEEPVDYGNRYEREYQEMMKEKEKEKEAAVVQQPDVYQEPYQQQDYQNEQNYEYQEPKQNYDQDYIAQQQYNNDDYSQQQQYGNDQYNYNQDNKQDDYQY